ncbi:MAG: hypothetical protein Q8942_17370, partial [Bacillota bacterium]|nr:hypothetical protein [Bacillota bacterium]
MSQILNEHWQEFKKTKLYKVSEHMRKSVIEAVEKALGCGDIKEGYTKFSVSNVTVGMKLSWD